MGQTGERTAASRKQSAGDALQSLGIRIFNQARIELCLSMRYLSRALHQLSFQMSLHTMRTGTDGERIYFHPEFVFRLYVESPQKFYRVYMHSLLHCLFSHIFKREDREKELWNLATDIQVEYVLDSMDVDLLRRPAYPFREAYFHTLEKEIKVLSAERIYAYLSEKALSYEERQRLAEEFVKDDHQFWEIIGEEKRSVRGTGRSEKEEQDKQEAQNEQREQSKEGEESRPEERKEERGESRQKEHTGQEDALQEKNAAADSAEKEEREKAQEGVDAKAKAESTEETEANGKEGGKGSETGSDKTGKNAKEKGDADSREKERDLADRWKDIGKRTEEEMQKKEKEGEEEKLSWFLTLSYKTYTPFQDFLRKLSVDKEELRTDPESFDYGYYYFGLTHYGNMPLIEENEYRESRKIPELVIAIDTSYSTKEKLVKRFLEETAAILGNKNTFFQNCTVHILECDDKIQKDIVFHSLEEIDFYRERFQVSGGYGTDFRPVFQYLADLRKRGELTELKALLYFTDGKGRYPKSAPGYPCAFIFPRGEEIEDENVPSWALKLYM